MLGVFQGVSKVNVDSLMAAEVVSAFSELAAQLDMRHGVGRNLQLEAKQTRQQVVMHVARPLPAAALNVELLQDMVHYAKQEAA